MPIADLVKEAEQIAAAGQREIVITGINTGDFGRTTGERFIDLLRALNEVEGIERYRISSIEPNLLTDEIIAFALRHLNSSIIFISRFRAARTVCLHGCDVAIRPQNSPSGSRLCGA